jgi:hypothetical protein
VPLKAKILNYNRNRAVFGNYLEGRDLIDKNGKKGRGRLRISLIKEALDYGSEFVRAFSLNTLK